MERKPLLTLVVPVFNEESSIVPFVAAIKGVISQLGEVSVELVFVNDGSQDATLQKIITSAKDSFIKTTVIDLSRNFGKESALTAGLFYASGDAVIPIDVDLQDPVELIPILLDKWRQGAEVVLAKRSDRSSDGWLKRVSAKSFYKIYNKISDLPMPENVGDFRLMDRIVVDSINALPENSRFMKGLFSWVGFKTDCVDYVRVRRKDGRSKFTGWKLWKFAIDGIASFSTLPLRIWTYIGFSISMIAFVYAVIMVGKVILYGTDVPGYASTIVAISLIGGIQLMGIGIIGEYLSRIFIETKRRPNYLVRKIYEM